MFKVALDAGHYNSSSGATYYGIKEVNINRVIIEHLKKLLIKEGFDVVDCISTKRRQRASLAQKVTQANKAGCDIYVSVHTNSSIFKKASGTETYYYPHSTKGYLLATCIHKELIHTLKRNDRGIKAKKLYVLKHTKMPAVLIEWLFLSNPSERTLAISPDSQKRCAEAIFRGILAYFGKKPSKADFQSQIRKLKKQVATLQDIINRIKKILP